MRRPKIIRPAWERRTAAVHPEAPEARTVDVDVESIDTRGRTLHGYAAVYGVESGDLGGFRETIRPGAFADVLGTDVRCLLNHDPNQVLGRSASGTLRLRDEERGLRFECDLPDSPLGENVREAVRRGDIDGASFRFKVAEDEWDDAGERRTILRVGTLSDVTVATFAAYPQASVELRTRQPDLRRRDRRGGLQPEDRTSEAVAMETRIAEAIRGTAKGERRSLTNADNSGGPISPPELSSFLFDRLRPASIALASGMVVIPTDRQKVTWPQLVSDVDPSWVDELEAIPADEPGFDTLEAEPKKLAHLVSPISNEVIDDSEPSAVDVLNGHLVTMMALKLDRGIFEGNAGADPKSINGVKYVSGIQTISMGTNGAALTDYDPIIEAVGKLRDANVPGPYAVASHGSVLTQLELLKESTDSNVQLPAPANLPPFWTSSQFSITETKGTATDARSIYVYAPGQIVLVRRKDAEIELDRSRLFNEDASEMRGVARADLLVPNPVAVVRIDGVIPVA